jgi:hypothetical protein
VEVSHVGAQLHNTSILYIKSRYMDCIFKVVTETELQPNNMDKKDGFFLSKSWKHFTKSFFPSWPSSALLAFLIPNYIPKTYTHNFSPTLL